MLCTFGDKMDVVWMHRYKLLLIEAMDKYGKLINAGEFNGLKAEEAVKRNNGSQRRIDKERPDNKVCVPC